MKLKTSSLCIMLALTGCNSSSSDDNERAFFDPTTATVAGIHNGLAQGDLTCVQVIEAYLQRADALDRQGPELNALINQNQEALERAKELDDAFAKDGLTGAMHCIPVTVKDNVNTADMPTTGGALANNQPLSDAHIVQQLRAAGAVIISKANLHEYAFGYQGGSLLGGVPRNAYDLSKGPGGSSSGTGTAVSASLALVGIGTDTGGSIRVPSSVQGLVGLRPSMRLLSLDGIMPLAPFQDTAGPMCRSVADCASFLSVMASFDSGQYSGQRQQFAIDAPLMSNVFQYHVITGAGDYTQYLDKTALQGARIGVVRDLFGSGESQDNQAVQAVMEAALEGMAAQGAVVEDVVIPDLNTLLTEYTSLSRYEFSYSLTEYLRSWSSDEDGHYRSFAEVHSSGEYLASSAGSFDFYAELGEDRWNDPNYVKNVEERPEVVRAALLQALDNKDSDGDYLGQRYDVLVYPSITGLAGAHGGNPTETGSANRLSPFSGFPALTMPVGYVSTDHDTSLPVGLEMLGREFDEGTLLKLAFAYEQAYQPRVEPELNGDMTPPSMPAQYSMIPWDDSMMN